MTISTIDTADAELARIAPGADLQQAVANLRDASTFADAVCRTALVPQAYRGNPAEATVAILFGAEVGLPPMQALQQVIVVKGTPGLYAKAAVALVIQRGHMIWVEASTPERVIVCGRNRHWTDDIPSAREEWTIDRAKQAGYYQQNRANYDGKPQEMLYARAAMNVARHVDPAALLGLPYSIEELRDGGFVTGEVIAEAPAYIPAEAPEQSPTPAITAPQSRALHAGLRGLGITDRADCLAWCAERVGRPLESSRDLTRDEASHLIDTLHRAAPAPEVDAETGEVVDAFPEATA